MAAQGSIREVYSAKFEFEAEDDTEVAFLPAHRIQILEKYDDEWWYGKNLTTNGLGTFAKEFLDLSKNIYDDSEMEAKQKSGKKEKAKEVPKVPTPVEKKQIEGEKEDNVQKSNEKTKAKVDMDIPAQPVSGHKKTVSSASASSEKRPPQSKSHVKTPSSVSSNAAPAAENNNFATWSEEEVGAWLVTCGLDEFVEVFQENNITGDILEEIDHDMLKEMDVKSLGKRAKILKSIRKLTGVESKSVESLNLVGNQENLSSGNNSAAVNEKKEEKTPVAGAIPVLPVAPPAESAAPVAKPKPTPRKKPPTLPRPSAKENDEPKPIEGSPKAEGDVKATKPRTLPKTKKVVEPVVSSEAATIDTVENLQESPIHVMPKPEPKHEMPAPPPKHEMPAPPLKQEVPPPPPKHEMPAPPPKHEMAPPLPKHEMPPPPPKHEMPLPPPKHEMPPPPPKHEMPPPPPKHDKHADVVKDEGLPPSMNEDAGNSDDSGEPEKPVGVHNISASIGNKLNNMFMNGPMGSPPPLPKKHHGDEEVGQECAEQGDVGEVVEGDDAENEIVGKSEDGEGDETEGAGDESLVTDKDAVAAATTVERQTSSVSDAPRSRKSSVVSASENSGHGEDNSNADPSVVTGAPTPVEMGESKEISAPVDRKPLLTRENNLSSNKVSLPSKVIENISREGYLFKQSGSGKSNWRKRLFVVHDDLIFYKHNEKDKDSVLFMTVKGYTFAPCTKMDNIKKKHSFKGSCKGDRDFFFAAESEQIMNDWIKTLNETSSAYSKTSQNAVSDSVADPYKSEPPRAPEPPPPLASIPAETNNSNVENDVGATAETSKADSEDREMAPAAAEDPSGQIFEHEEEAMEDDSDPVEEPPVVQTVPKAPPPLPKLPMKSSEGVDSEDISSNPPPSKMPPPLPKHSSKLSDSETHEDDVDNSGATVAAKAPQSAVEAQQQAAAAAIAAKKLKRAQSELTNENDEVEEGEEEENSEMGKPEATEPVRPVHAPRPMAPPISAAEAQQRAVAAAIARKKAQAAAKAKADAETEAARNDEGEGENDIEDDNNDEKINVAMSRPLENDKSGEELSRQASETNLNEAPPSNEILDGAFSVSGMDMKGNLQKLKQKSGNLGATHQKQQYTMEDCLRWMQAHLKESDVVVEEVVPSMKDGVAFIVALENASGQACGKYRKKCTFPIHRIDNINVSLNFAKKLGINVQDIAAEEIHEGSEKMTLVLFESVFKIFPPVKETANGAEAEAEAHTDSESGPEDGEEYEL
eukprot:Nk52_evm43s2309 gene=Nk52_evmTU43s2309